MLLVSICYKSLEVDAICIYSAEDSYSVQEVPCIAEILQIPVQCNGCLVTKSRACRTRKYSSTSKVSSAVGFPIIHIDRVLSKDSDGSCVSLCIPLRVSRSFAMWIIFMA